MVRAAIGGILAALAGLAAGQVAAAILGTGQTPVVAIGSAFIDRTPPWLKDLAISVFGTHDKLALKTGILIVLLAFAALGGVLAVLRYAAGAAVVVILAGIAVIAAQTRPDAGQTGFVPSFVAGVVALLVLRLFSQRLAGLLKYPDDGVSRRGFLQLSAGVALGSVAVGALGNVIGGHRSAVTDARERAPAAVAAEPRPAGRRTGSGCSAVGDAERGLLPDRHRAVGAADHAGGLEAADPRHGRPRDRAGLRRPAEAHGRAQVGHAHLRQQRGRWRPDRQRALVRRAAQGPAERGRRLAQGRRDPVDVEGRLHRRYAVEHAARRSPVDARLRDEREAAAAGTRVPGAHRRTGSVWVRLGDQVADGHRGDPVRPVRGVLDAAWVVRSKDRSSCPRGSTYRGRRRRPGQVTVAGVAWDQHVGVSKVEVRVDGGAWQEATLAADASIDTWRQWHWTWDAPRGHHVLQVRAFDAKGNPQVESQAPPAPNGSTGLHSVDIKVG